ncbi:MAG TPA: ring-cleaving dioxygenase [Vicinamibacterales bacterium]|nr:ring-cleaving dioxygenase [Vicinamibacterales bacterium]
MAHPILGLHHVTATVDDAQADLDFCLQRLALRLVKKTVNFDNHNVYHFYYGTERGAPGTIWTTFPYKGHGVRMGARGAGQIVTTSFSVPRQAMSFWHERLDGAGVATTAVDSGFGESTLQFKDPSGLDFSLVGADADDREPWAGGDADRSVAVRGLHSVTLLVRALDPTIDFMSSVLGYTVAGRTADRARLVVSGDRPGHRIDLVANPQAPIAANGIGTVHHVAMAIATEEQQLALRRDLVDAGVQVTPVMDRCYFRSIYFREPGGVLFEVATMQPGFMIDEPIDALGRDLKLPPWEEPNRRTIETHLPAVTY